MADTVVIPPQQTQEDPKHIEAMIAKVDEREAQLTQESPTAEPPSNPEKPEWVPEKFWNAEKGEVRTEALAQSYKELESKQGAAKKEGTAAKTEESTEVDPNAATQEDAAKALAEKGLNLDDFNVEFQQKGTLSDESYEKLEKAGYPRAYVDSYIAGQKALADQYTEQVQASIGGAENFNAMVDWAKTNVDPKEIAAYNRAVGSGDPDAAKLAVAGLYQRYQEANPTEPSLVKGATGATVGDVYEDRSQLIADMAKPEYKDSPAFRKKVEAKIARSNIL